MSRENPKSREYALDSAFYGMDKQRFPWTGATLVIDYFDGTVGHVWIQIGDREDNLWKVWHQRTMSIPENVPLYVINTADQTGKVLEISVAEAGSIVTPGARTSEASEASEATLLELLATKQNQTTLAAGQKAVPTGTAEAIASSTAVPNGYAVVVKALAANTATVLVGPSGVETGTGFELSAGESVSVYVDNLADLYVISGSASQKVCYLVEQAS